MINLFTIFDKGGAVLWSNENNPPAGNPVNTLIRDVLLEDRTGDDQWTYDRYTLRWQFDNELNLVFVAVYLKLQRLSYIANLLERVRKEFTDEFRARLLAGTRAIGNLGTKFHDPEFTAAWNKRYAAILLNFEKKKVRQKQTRKPRSFAESSKAKFMTLKESDNSRGEATTGPEEDEKSDAAKSPGKRKQLPAHLRKRGAGRRAGPRGFQKKKGKGKAKEPAKPKEKKGRDWTNLGIMKNTVSQQAMNELDMGDGEKAQRDDWEVARGQENVDLAESDDEDWESEEEEEVEAEQSSGGVWSYFGKLTGTKALTLEDLEPALDMLATQLMGKNVAVEITKQLVKSVGESLMQSKTGAFTSIKSKVRQAASETLERILTPAKKVDILYGIRGAREQGRPYTVVFVGVNGVGKSTSLAKVINYLSNKRGLQVSVAACDTFRAGAVEQLKTHCRALKARLFQRGYTKDPALVAQEAIVQGKAKGDDVVLVDTAGRMQDNVPLMRALSKLIIMNQPDLVLFVGEALVGNDGVDQLMKFNQALQDHSKSANPRLIDGIFLTKFDTVDDKVGAAISMTYQSRKPLVFIGTGQGYDDIKRPNAKTLISKLLR